MADNINEIDLELRLAPPTPRVNIQFVEAVARTPEPVTVLSRTPEASNEGTEGLSYVEEMTQMLLPPSELALANQAARNRASICICSICLNALLRVVSIVSVGCGHVFCSGCIHRALQGQRKCPICRSPIDVRSIRRIYLNYTQDDGELELETPRMIIDLA
ncbi:hypothetical protein ACFE04_019933 [Oxalis oulophora]